MSQKAQNVENYLLDTAIKVIEADESQNQGRDQDEIWFDQVAKINSIIWENAKSSGMSESEIQKTYPKEAILNVI